jgi:cell division protein FtsI (penicillin-binding protein 3)
MVAFYNAIANGGKMMRPRLIKEIQRDGHTVQKIDSQVAVESIARPEAIADITQCLIGVVNSTDGTGTRAHSDRFIIAGKTGTAKVDEHGQYAGRWLNFCGFFPADKPEYTCGVFVFRKAGHTGTANGGGTMSAPVLREIAERVMAYQKTTRIEDLRDSLAIFVPDVKTGNVAAADEVLDGLRIKGDSLRGKDITTEEGKVPNVVGMGAKDALYALESCGIKGHLNGFGKVHRQAIAPGADRKKGMTVELYLK